MTLTLVPMKPSSFAAWRARSHQDFAEELEAIGLSSDDAQRRAEESFDRAFPEGEPTATSVVFDLLDDDAGVVGYVWIGRDSSNDPTRWWVWDVLVNEAYRGRGFGREAMKLGEEYARKAGARSLGLNVFGHNVTALGLYTSLGFEITNINMRKVL